MPAPPAFSRAAQRLCRCSGIAFSNRETPKRATASSAAAVSAPIPITSASHPRCCRAGAPTFARRISATAPSNVNTTCVIAPIETSATMAAVASAAGTPPAVNSRARAKSPPI